jgi:hypothetical protein
MNHIFLRRIKGKLEPQIDKKVPTLREGTGQLDHQPVSRSSIAFLISKHPDPFAANGMSPADETMY